MQLAYLLFELCDSFQLRHMLVFRRDQFTFAHRSICLVSEQLIFPLVQHRSAHSNLFRYVLRGAGGRKVQ
ncbi:hypothetical protein AWV80_31155 [Cupriavidus sp. UYMU48A]|nr:hypothetical protein AWV80_31155 [Cupriavidus sp. UYMU48A]